MLSAHTYMSQLASRARLSLLAVVVGVDLEKLLPLLRDSTFFKDGRAYARPQTGSGWANLVFSSLFSALSTAFSLRMDVSFSSCVRSR